MRSTHIWYKAPQKVLFFLQKVLFFSSKSAFFCFFCGKLLCEDWDCEKIVLNRVTDNILWSWFGQAVILRKNVNEAWYICAFVCWTTWERYWLGLVSKNHASYIHRLTTPKHTHTLTWILQKKIWIFWLSGLPTTTPDHGLCQFWTSRVYRSPPTITTPDSEIVFLDLPTLTFWTCPYRVPTVADQQNSMIFPGFPSFFQVFFVFFVHFIYPFSKTNKVKWSIFLPKEDKLLAKIKKISQESTNWYFYWKSIKFEKRQYIFELSLILGRLCVHAIQNKILISPTFVSYELESNQWTSSD